MTRHQVETELSDIRREMARLKRRESQLIENVAELDTALPRPGWPMRRADATFRSQVLAVQTVGAMISTSTPARIAV